MGSGASSTGGRDSVMRKYSTTVIVEDEKERALLGLTEDNMNFLMNAYRFNHCKSQFNRMMTKSMSRKLSLIEDIIPSAPLSQPNVSGSVDSLVDSGRHIKGYFDATMRKIMTEVAGKTPYEEAKVDGKGIPIFVDEDDESSGCIESSGRKKSMFVSFSRVKRATLSFANSLSVKDLDMDAPTSGGDEKSSLLPAVESCDSNIYEDNYNNHTIFPLRDADAIDQIVIRNNIDPKDVLNCVRAAFILDNETQIVNIFEAVKAHPRLEIKKVVNFFTNAGDRATSDVFNDYRYIVFYLDVENDFKQHHICELQVHLGSFLAFRKELCNSKTFFVKHYRQGPRPARRGSESRSHGGKETAEGYNADGFMDNAKLIDNVSKFSIFSQLQEEDLNQLKGLLVGILQSRDLAKLETLKDMCSKENMDAKSLQAIVKQKLLELQEKKKKLDFLEYFGIFGVAVSLLNADKFEDAEPLLKRALAGYEIHRGSTHEETRDVQNKLIQCLRQLDKLTEAEVFMRREWYWYEDQLDGGSLSLRREALKAQSDLANCLLKQSQKIDEAEHWLKINMQLRETLLDCDNNEEDFLSAVECIRQLARVCELKYQNSDAEAYYNRCLKSYEDHFKDPEHDRCLDILEELTKFHSRLGDLEKTLKFSKKTFEGYQRKRGIEDKQCLKSLYRYIATLIKLKRWEDALPLGKTCVEMNAKVYGVDEVFKVDHKETKDAKQQLAVIENKGAIAILQ